jgi:sterol O-acyltransferase
MLAAFLLSAVAHELLMAVVTKIIRWCSSQTSLLVICEKINLFERGNRLNIFVLQLIQIPMIAVARLLAIRGKKFLGNATLYAGLSLLCIAYAFY